MTSDFCGKAVARDFTVDDLLQGGFCCRYERQNRFVRRRNCLREYGSILFRPDRHIFENVFMDLDRKEA